MATIPEKTLRNEVGEVLRRAEAGEELTVTVAGRPVARPGPLRGREWVSGGNLAAVWATPPPATLAADLQRFGGALAVPSVP